MEQELPREIISKLFVSKEAVIERLSSLVDLSKHIITIVEESGEVLVEDSGLINNSERIFLNLLGSYFSFQSELKNKSSMKLIELSDKIGIPVTTIPAPMNSLINEKLVLKLNKGEYQINFVNYNKIKEFLQKIRSKIKHIHN